MALRTSTTAFAKSTRPDIGGVVLREALFERLDGSLARTVAWISAPPGFGKTTLAASYIEARQFRSAWYQVDADDDNGESFLHYLAHATRELRGDATALPTFSHEGPVDVRAFARRYFRALFAGVTGPAAVAIDNLHDMAADSVLRAILEAGLPEVPRSCCVIITSRAAPPPALARLQTDGRMVCMTTDDLRLTPIELAEMARQRGLPIAQDQAQSLQQRVDGWAAALVLMIEHRKLARGRPPLADDAPPEVVFDYLAGEIFNRFEATTQRLLLCIACVPRVTIELAQKLSGDDLAGRVLINLARNDYFVRELAGAGGRVFVFHPLLQEFLLRRAACDLPQALGAEALRQAACLLRESGQAEDAVALAVQSKDWALLADIAAEQTEGLLAQGRHSTLAAWIEALPPQWLAADGALLQGHGAALLHTSPRLARRRFEQAFELRKSAGDHAGMAGACLGVIGALLREFDDLSDLGRWLATFDRCAAAAGQAADAPAAVLAARLWIDPAQVDPGLGAAAHESAPHGTIIRSIAAALRGDFARATALANAMAASTPAFSPELSAMTLLRQLIDGDHAAALVQGQAGLAASEINGWHGNRLWLHLICAAAATALGEVQVARVRLDALQALALRRGDRAFVHLLEAGLARASGNPTLALREARSAALLAVEVGLPWPECLARLLIAQLLAAAGEHATAEAQLREVEALAQRLGSPVLAVAHLFTAAAVAMDAGLEAAALAPLQSGFAVAQSLGLRHVLGVSSASLAALCALALRHGVAVDQARALIIGAHLAPPPSALRLRRWPWPFEVITLGSFGLRRAGEPLEFSAKGPGRPVELLKVLIALGGQNVRADQLADALWPHVDADYAHKSFTATLHRLRRIFGEDDTLRLRDGRLSLNATMFWVDSWALDQLCAEMDIQLRDVRALDAGDASDACGALADEVLTLYRGPFLSDETEQPAYIARREQSRSRLLRALARLARRWDDAGNGDAVVDCWLRCIDADELCEAFYRNLMLCQQRQGGAAEARATYARLQAVLAARLRSVPAPETQALYAALSG